MVENPKESKRLERSPEMAEIREFIHVVSSYFAFFPIDHFACLQAMHSPVLE